MGNVLGQASQAALRPRQLGERAGDDWHGARSPPPAAVNQNERDQHVAYFTALVNGAAALYWFFRSEPEWQGGGQAAAEPTDSAQLASGQQRPEDGGHVSIELLLDEVAGADPPPAPAAAAATCSAGGAAIGLTCQELPSSASLSARMANELFIQACSIGDETCASKLLSATGAMRANVCYNGQAAFTKACAGGHHGIVCLLLQETSPAVDVHAGEEAAFYTACKHGRLEIVQVLLALTGARWVDVHARRDGPDALQIALINGHAEVAQCLIDLNDAHDHRRRFDVSEQADGAFLTACKRGHAAVVRLLLSLRKGRNCDDAPPEWLINTNAGNAIYLRVACLFGHVGVVRLLLALDARGGERRVDVRAEQDDALRNACAMGRFEVVQLLLELGGDRYVDVHAQNDASLRLACAGGHVRVVRLLLSLEGDRRTDVHANANEAFRNAYVGGHAEVVRLILQLDGELQPPRQELGQEVRLVSDCFVQSITRGKLPPSVLAELRVPMLETWVGIFRECLSPAHVVVDEAHVQTAGAAVAEPLAAARLLELAADTPRAQLQQAAAYQIILAVHAGLRGQSAQDGKRLAPVIIVMFCCALPLFDCQALRHLLVQAHTFDWSDAARYLVGRMFAQFADAFVDDEYCPSCSFEHEVPIRFAWRGLAIPVAPAPGSDALLRGPANVLRRPARRGMILHRAASRLEHTERASDA